MSAIYYDLFAVDVPEAIEGLKAFVERTEANPQKPIFIVLEMINMFDDVRIPKYEAIQYENMELVHLESMLLHPEKAWSIYKDSHDNISSDVVAKIVTVSKDPSEREEYPDVWETTKIAMIDTNTMDEEALADTPFRDFINAIPAYLDHQSHNNGFLNAVLKLSYNKSNDEFPLEKDKIINQFWIDIIKSPQKRLEMSEKKQLFVGIECSYDFLDVPCAIYSLRREGVDESIIDEMLRNHLCYGEIIKTKAIVSILSKYHIALRVYKLSSYKEDKVKVTYDIYPKKIPEGWRIVELDYFEGHLMQHEMVEIHYEERVLIMHFLRLLYWGFQNGVLRRMTSFEYGRYRSDYAVMIKDSYKEQIEYIKTLEDPFEQDCEAFIGRSPKAFAIKIFADFECTTDERYHREFTISYSFNGEIKHIWGENCGKQFLDQVGKICRQHSDRTRFNSPKGVIYFHNLRYDFTFLLKYLSKVDITKKGNTLYRVKAFYGTGTNKVCLEFRDTLPLLQMSLRNAGNAFLPEEVKKTIKKEVFPYELYTYSFFEKYPDGWAPVEEAKQYFKPEEYQEFILNLKKTLPFIPQFEDHFDEYNTTRRKRLTYKSNMFIQEEYEYHYSSDRMFYQNYDRNEYKYEELFNYKEYAHFYCDQDVRVLYEVMKVYDSLMTGGQTEGINGVPPFGKDYSPFQYLTISSLAYDYCLKNCVFEKGYQMDENYFIKRDGRDKPIPGWQIRHRFYQSKGLLRYIGHQTVRGGRVMCRDNEKYHYVMDPSNPESMLVDYDGVSLYPSAISRLWMTEGKPGFIHGSFSEQDFIREFTHPDAPEGEFKKYNDGWIHVYSIHCSKDRHFPMLCIKDKETKLNDYKNWHGHVDTWVNAIDLYNLIDFQDATFYWDCAVVWEGKRYYECRSMIRNLFDFRLHNKKHPIQLTTKLMMNSIYGKSALKPVHYEEEIVDVVKWRKNEENGKKRWSKVDNWRAEFNANAYKIKSFTMLDDDHVSVKYHKKDTTANYVQFGSNVLAMARRIIGRVMSLAEDMELEHPECAPGLFYTDTDSMHIRKDLLKYTEEAYLVKYGSPICGTDLCQFHIDFDAPKNFKEGEYIEGANESWFIMKKMYADQLVGSQGSICYHQRMKGVPSDLVKWTDYEKIFNDQFVVFDLLENGHVSFFYENGMVGSRRDMKRQIATKEAKEQIKEDLNTVKNFVRALEELDKTRTPTLFFDEEGELPLTQVDEIIAPNRDPGEPILDEDTQPLPVEPEEPESLKRAREDEQIDIETDDEEFVFKLPKVE